jgi:tRNA(fMet)-specific endonuclease VapC
MFVLDTNTLVFFFKGMGQVANNLLLHSPKDIGIPAIVLYELEVGIGKSTLPAKRTKQLAEIVSVVNVLPFDTVEAQVAARIRVALEAKGEPIGPYDVLIAATAMANQATLITHNTNEFARIENLLLEDWF